MLFSTSKDVNGTHGHGFTDQPWGKRVCEAMQSTRRLKDHNWAQIEEHTSIYIQITDHTSDEGHGEDDIQAEASGMHANIDIDWYVHPLPVANK
jgi:hypothetical protein